MFSADLGVTPSASTLYADEVFSTLLYTGNGSSLTVNNGIDLAGKGGMVWVKNRTQSPGRDHYVFDSVRGANYTLYPNQTYAQVLQGSGTTLSSTGFTTTYGDADFNASGQSYVSWTFREAPKFFDVVTYTGDGTGTSRLLTHNLGITPGLYFIKSTSATGDWLVGAPGLGTNRWANLNTTFNWGNNTSFWLASSATTFGPGNTGGSNILNVNGQTYVAYLFADDPSTTGLIRCGSFTTDANGNASVTSLGWEPQFLMVKASSTTGDWIMLDSLRGWNMTSADALLRANLPNAETTSTEYGNPTATGFDFKGGAASASYIYMAIRRPNKPPTSGTDVFNVGISSTSGPIAGAGATSAVHQVDLAIAATRVGGASNFQVSDRLRGFTSSYATTPFSVTSTTAAQTTGGLPFAQVGVSGSEDMVYAYADGTNSRVGYAFKRAPGFLDIVSYTFTGAVQTISHRLGAIPQLVIAKSLTSVDNWETAVYVGPEADRFVVGDTASAQLSLNAANGGINSFAGYYTANTFNTDMFWAKQTNGARYIVYLFGSVAGVSKIGTYVGNGTSRSIDCGFAAGARFLLIKRMSAAGDWYVWDTARGIVAANDPRLSLNGGLAEVATDDSVDPISSGFTVNQITATNLNVSSSTYFYFAVA